MSDSCICAIHLIESPFASKLLSDTMYSFKMTPEKRWMAHYHCKSQNRYYNHSCIYFDHPSKNLKCDVSDTAVVKPDDSNSLMWVCPQKTHTSHQAVSPCGAHSCFSLWAPHEGFLWANPL